MSAVKRLFFALMFVGSVSLAQAAVIGTFVSQGSGVYRFDVTNNDAVSYSGFSFGGAAGTGDGGFTGAFTQFFGNGTIAFNTSTTGAVGTFPETYFFGNAPTVSVNIVDTTTNLEGAFDYGATLLAPGQTITAAIFSTSNNTIPTFLGGFASNTSVTVPITAAAVPEPSTLALVGMGVVGMVGYIRRKRTTV